MIKVCIKGQTITDFSTPDIVADSIDYITAAFNFHSPEWEELTKYAHFSNSVDNYDIELIDDVISADKHLNFTAGEWTIWLSGHLIENGELKQRITTNQVVFPVKGTGTTDTGNPFPSAVPSMTEQILTEMGDIEQLETANKQTLVDAINEVFRTAGGEISPELIAEAVEKYLKKNPVEAVSDHEELTGREKENQHPISAIKELQSALDSKQPKGEYLTEETDPTVPEWAKKPEKPTYTAKEVGALPDTTKIPSLDGYATEQFVKDEIGKIELPEAGEGVTDHAMLTGRDKAEQHPISAITNLQQTLDSKQPIGNYALAADIPDVSGLASESYVQTYAQPKGNYADANAIPTKLSQLEGDTTHRTVSDAEKAEWSGKSDFDGSYNSLTDKPAIPTIPTDVSAFNNDVGYISISENTFSNGSTINISDGYSEWTTADNISSLVFTYPSDSYEAWIKFITAASGAVTITLPASQYIGEVPIFGNSEIWEMSIKDGVVIAAKTA